jgi:ABC-type branched-subunit amino acid transport system substrate-binding protein
MSKWFVPALFLFIVLSQARAADTACKPADGSPLRFGTLFPAQGLFQQKTDSQRGIEAVVAAINACGGVGGHPVELVSAQAHDYAEALSVIRNLNVPLIIGSGAGFISQALMDASASGAFVYWEVTEPLDAAGKYAFSPRPSSAQIGAAGADFIAGRLTPVLNSQPARVTLVAEDRSRRLSDSLDEALNPILEKRYRNLLRNAYPFAVQVREKKSNVVAVTAFEDDADQFWFDLRQADATISAWVQLTTDSVVPIPCARFGQAEAFISVGPVGPASADYRASLGGDYERFAKQYQEKFDVGPSPRADLAASGVYLLLRYALADAESFTPDGIRSAVLSAHIDQAAGFWGEGLDMEETTGLNRRAAVLVSQQQRAGLCVLEPAEVATCQQPVQPFGTWRQRALANQPCHS